MYFVIVGPPGAGKGTQAAIMSERLSVPHISTGAMLRDSVATGSELGKKVKGLIEGGSLVDDETMLAVVEERLSQPDCSKGFLLDGYPRNLSQGSQLQVIFDKIGIELSSCLYFELGEEEAVKRMQKRADEEGRADDTPEVQRKRIKVYKEQTEPLLDFYKKSGNLVKIDSSGSKEEVTGLALSAAGFD